MEPLSATGFGRSRIFPGWFVVAGAFAITFVGFGSAYSFGAFVTPLEREFAASRGSISLVFSIAGFLYFAMGAVSGPLADRWGPRRLAIAGMIVVGAGLMAAAAAKDLLGVYVAYGVGIGVGVGSSYVPALGAVQRWFIQRRGFASGLAVSGIGVGTLVMPPLASYLIHVTGWRRAYLILGLLAAVLGTIAALRLESDPRKRGLGPDGAPLEAGTTDVVPSGLSVREAIKTRRFAYLYAACLVASFGLFVPFVHLIPYAVAHGIDEGTAVLLVGMIGVGSTAGRFFLGSVADRMGRRHALLATFLGMALMLAFWLVASALWSLALFALAFGTFYGGFVAIMPAMVMDSFGGRSVSGIIGVLYTSVAFGTLVGPSAAGYAFDLTHSYALPIAASVVANLIAAALMTRLDP